MSHDHPPSGPLEPPEGLQGPELARAVIDAAKARRETARAQRRTQPRPGAGESGRRLRGYSGPGPDPGTSSTACTRPGRAAITTTRSDR